MIEWMLSNLWMIVTIVIVAIATFFIYIIRSAPGRIETIDQDGEATPSPPISNPFDSLRANWDSEAYADWPVAELLAEVSQYTYLPPGEAEVELNSLGFQEVTPVIEASMVGYVAITDDVAVIAYRGTDDLTDWLANLDRSAIETTHGDIHRGFYNAYQRLRPQILPVLQDAKPKHLWITGHSLGGALAVVCAYDFAANEDMTINGLITFGQPMVAKSGLAKHLDESTLGFYAHYVNDSDIVARVPPSFQHCGSLVWFTGDGVKRSKPKRKLFGAVGTEEMALTEGEEVEPLSEQEFEELQERLRSASHVDEQQPGERVAYQGMLPMIGDHAMELYLQRIRDVRN